jgi:hypothetical protein
VKSLPDPTTTLRRPDEPLLKRAREQALDTKRLRPGANTRPSSARLVSGLGRDLADLAQQLLYELAALRIVDLEGWM